MSDTQTGEPLDKLTPSTQAQIAQLGSQCTTVSEIIQQRDKAVYDAIQRGINTVNDHTYDSYVSVESVCLTEYSVTVHYGQAFWTFDTQQCRVLFITTNL